MNKKQKTMKEIMNDKRNLSTKERKESQKIASLQRSRRGYLLIVRNIYFTGGLINTGIAN